MCFVQDAAGRFALVHSPRRDAWGSPGGWREGEESVPDAAVREIREETGLVVGADDLEVCAYERFTVDGEVRGRWLPGRSYLQVYRTRVFGMAPVMAATEADVDGWRWVDRAEFERLCGAHFSVAAGSAALQLSPAGPSVVAMAMTFGMRFPREFPGSAVVEFARRARGRRDRRALADRGLLLHDRAAPGRGRPGLHGASGRGSRHPARGVPDRGGHGGDGDRDPGPSRRGGSSAGSGHRIQSWMAQMGAATASPLTTLDEVLSTCAPAPRRDGQLPRPRGDA